MCKHIAATLYGVGVRLDQKPELSSSSGASTTPSSSAVRPKRARA